VACRDAMGIAVPVGEPRPAVSSSYACQERTPRSSPDPFADLPDRSSGCFSNQNWQEPLRTTSSVFRGKFLIPERLAPAGSSAAVRFPAPGSPGPPRSETSARGAILLPRELEMRSRLTRTPRSMSRGFASKGRVVRRVCGGEPARLGSLPRKQRTAGRAQGAGISPESRSLAG
jgi:hypothetical protein